MCRQNQKPTNTEIFKLHDQGFGSVNHIKYFGFILANDDKITSEMLQRFVTNGQTCYGLKELSLLYLGKGLRSVRMFTYCSVAGPSQEKIKEYSKCLKQKYQEISIGKLMKMVYGSQGDQSRKGEVAGTPLQNVGVKPLQAATVPRITGNN
jgi:hypothetical protein